MTATTSTPAYTRPYTDAERVSLALTERGVKRGPLEIVPCPHARPMKFRYEWPEGTCGPDDGHVVIVQNDCLDCALAVELQQGARRKT